MRLWPALDAIPTLAAVERTWRAHVAEEWTLLEPFLAPRQLLAASIDDGDGAIREIREHGPDDIVAICARTGDVRSVTRAEIVVHSLAERLVSREIARALDVEGTPRPRSAACASWLLGTVASGARTPTDVVWIARASPELAASEAADVAASADPPPIVITPTRAARSERLDALVARGACEWRVASDLLAWEAPGRLVAHASVVGEADDDNDSTAGPVIALALGLRLDAARCAVSLSGATVVFDGKKGHRFTLLRLLARRPGTPVSQASLRKTDAPWSGKSLGDRSLKVAVNRLKKDLERRLPAVAAAISTRRVGNELRPVLDWPPPSVPEV
jgi:hypothetical protein